MSLLASAIATSHRGFPLFQYAAGIVHPTQLKPVCKRLILTGQKGSLEQHLPLLEWCSKEFDATYVLFESDADAAKYKTPKNTYVLNNTYHYLADTGRIVTSNPRNDHADIYVVDKMTNLPSHLYKNKTYLHGTGTMDLRFTNNAHILSNEFGNPGYQKDRIYYE